MCPEPSPTDGADVPDAGVPLGGVGAGCIEMGADGRLRNVTINNNRLASERIPWADSSFLAIRAASADDTHVRVLQNTSSIDFESAGIRPPYTQPADFTWSPLYPASAYRLEPSSGFPLKIQWRGFSPILPYDTEASTLPLVVFHVDIENNSRVPYTISTLFNWENIRGCTAKIQPHSRGPIETFVSSMPDVHAKSSTLSEEELAQKVLGLTFGIGEQYAANAEGDYSLAAQYDDRSEMTYMAWSKTDVDSIKDFWWNFHDKGSLPNTLSRTDDAHCGSVCVSRTLEPGKRHAFYMLLAWYCPRYEVNGEDLGNGYTVQFSDSVDVVSYGLIHVEYFAKALNNWHNRFLKSSFPTWFSRMLLNNSYVLSTNSFYTKEAEFVMMESPGAPLTGLLDRHFYSSLGTLLFFPNFAQLELALLTKTEESDDPGRVFRQLGNGTIREPGLGAMENEMLDLGAKAILLACRNYRMTGNRVRLMDIYPRLRSVLTHALELDDDNDGIPDMHGTGSTFEDWEFYGLSCYVGGLWIAAFHALAYLARELGHTEDAEACEGYAKRARSQFEKRLWIEKEGYYRLYDERPSRDPRRFRRDDSCLTAQLAGPWMANFLCLEDCGFDEGRIQRALKAIQKRTRKKNGVQKGAGVGGKPCQNPENSQPAPRSEDSWSYLSACYYACAQMQQGNTDEGLDVLSAIYDRILKNPKYQFNQPFSWDTAKNLPTGPGQDRHMSSLAIWHALYALQGCFLSVPDQILYVVPNLPKGVKFLDAPIFTPVTLGSLTFEIHDDDGYFHSAKLSFESPIQIRLIVLRVPTSITDVSVYMQCDGDVSASKHYIETGIRMNTVYIDLNTTLLVQDSMSVSVFDSVYEERHEASEGERIGARRSSDEKKSQ